MQEDEFRFKNFFKPLTTLKVVHLIIFIGFVVYGNSLFNGFVWDDLPQFVNNNLYHSILNTKNIFLDHSFTYYRPIPAIALAGIYTLVGPVAFWYHLFQVTIHIINTIFIYLIFKKFTGRSTSFILCLIFLVHPINVEAVSYVSSLQIIISMFFGLIALLLSYKFRTRSSYGFGLVFLLLLFSLLSKETGFIFVILLIPFIVIDSQRNILLKDLGLPAITLSFASLAYIIFRFFVTNTPIDTDFTDSPIPIMHASLVERLTSLPKILFFYIQKVIYPSELAISQNWLVKNPNLYNFVIPTMLDTVFFILLLIPAMCLFARRRKQLYTYIFFLILFIFSWGIHWNIIPLDMTVADRWFYFALVGLLGLIGIVVGEINFSKNQLLKVLIIGFAAVAITLLSIRTMIRNRDWSNSSNLYKHDLKISTESYDLENFYAYNLLVEKKYDEAYPHIKRSIDLAPKFWVNWENLGVYYESKGQIDKSIDAFKTAIRNNKDYHHAYINLANIYFHYKKPEDVKAFLIVALNEYPNEPSLLYIAGVTDYRLGDKEKAIGEILKAHTHSRDPRFIKLKEAMEQDKKI